MTNKKFNVDITATDKTAKALKGAEARFEKWEKTGKKLSKGFGGLGDKLVEMTGSAGKAAGGLAEAAEGAYALAGTAGVAATGVGALVVGLIVATKKAIEFTEAYATSGAEIGRTSKTLGVTVDQLQAFRGAGEKAGVSADAITDSMKSLNDVLFNAENKGGDAMGMLNYLGIKLKHTKDGMIDTKAAALDLADAMARQNPEAQAQIAKMFGMEASLPFWRRGRKAIEADLEEFMNKSGVLNEKQTETAEKYEQAMVGFKQSWHGVKSIFAEGMMPAITAVIHGLTGILDLLGHIRHAETPALNNFHGWLKDHGAPGWLQHWFDRTDGQLWDDEKPGAKAKPAPAPGPPIDWGIPEGPIPMAFGHSSAWRDGLQQASYAMPAGGYSSGGGARGGAGSLGIRNNNPGNLRDPRTGQFMRFATPEQGLARMAWQLRRYQDRYHRNTIAQIIGRWAPPSDHNDTGAYVADVSKQTGFAPGQALDLHNPQVLAALAAAMIQHENGRNPYSSQQIAGAAGGQRDKVDVHVRLTGAPHGTMAQVSSTPGVNASARVERAMA
ncbi:MAG: hypothetical protein ACXWKY_00865 [Caulobacteraceae bacterium]